MIKLTFTQKLRLNLFGNVSVGTRMKKGWSAPIEHYAFKCPVHGLVIDYKRGYIERLDCPKCIKEYHAEPRIDTT